MTRKYNNTITDNLSGQALSESINWREIVEKITFAYVVFVFITFTSAFVMFELVAPTSAIVYLGGVVLIGFKVPVLFSRPLILVIVMMFPVYAFTSAFWGVAPDVVIGHSFQLIFTALLAASIGCALRPHQLMLAMSVAFGGLVVISVANLWLQIVPAFQQEIYLQGNEYFTGIFTHKNKLGGVLCMAALCFSYLILKSTPRWPFVLLLLSVLPILLFARSTTSLVLYAYILSMPFVYLLCRQKNLRLVIVIGLICAGVSMVMLLEIFDVSIIDTGLELAGKGRDLNGRTSLWDIALARFSENPWLGVGYQSFWTSDQFSKEVNSVYGFLENALHFHNAWLEALVGLGLVGTVTMAIVPVALICVLLPRLIGKQCSPIHIAGIYFSVFVLVRSNLEVSIYYQHQSESVALTALLVSVLLYSNRTTDLKRMAEPDVTKF